MKENNVEYTKNLDEAKHFMECKVCYVDFDNDQHVPLGQLCGHTFCSACISQQPLMKKCPLCKAKMGDQQNKNM